MTNIRAILRSEVKNAYRELPVLGVESYSIDSALDTDSDQFSVDIGDPRHQLAFLNRRDQEIRVALYDAAQNPPSILLQGLCDISEYDETRVLSLNGRDLSSIAVDSDAPPMEKYGIVPHKWVGGEAAKLGLTKQKLAHVSTYNARFYRDASETYWQSWYRLYRKRKMWMWVEPDGTLFADNLNYTNAPSYYFGSPTSGDTNPRRWHQVEGCKIANDRQKRVYEVWVYGERGDVGFRGTGKDTSIASWQRHILKILNSTTAKNQAEARQEALEELFEGKVGATEITLVIRKPAVPIRQNTMAMVNVPWLDLKGLFFVVGTQLSGSSSGETVTVRLREKNYAISRRVPTDPELAKDPARNAPSGSVGGALSGSGIRWASAFTAAAQEFHDGWDFALWLGVLLAICDKESGFGNKREGGQTEWYPKPTAPSSSDDRRYENPVEHWMNEFANASGNRLNPYSREAGVGPMQLTSLGYKQWADDYGGIRDEYEGGRWQPVSNIRAGARALAEKLKATGADPGDANQIWIGVKAYNGSGAAADAYMNDVRNRWKTTYKETAESAVEATDAIPPGTTTNKTITLPDGSQFQVQVPDNALPTVKKAINFALRQIGKWYEWGKAGPNTYDCSGLVEAAYYAAGERDAVLGGNGVHGGTALQLYDWYRPNQKVTKDTLTAGDFVFFNNFNHVGMYLNDDHFIQASRPGTRVSIASMNSGYYHDNLCGIARVVYRVRGPH
jgi:cell wall-associated NlpC family hydrolase/prophage tail gpP-like protein